MCRGTDIWQIFVQSSQFCCESKMLFAKIKSYTHTHSLSLSLCMITVLYSEPQSKKGMLGFPGGTVVENLPANAGDMGSSPGLGRSHMLQSD